MYYAVKNLFAEYADYFVPSQDAADAIPDSHPAKPFIFVGGQAEAEARLASRQVDAFEYYAANFSVCIASKTELGEVWRAPVDGDPEVGDYHVFDYKTGQYAPCDSRALAVAENEKLKQEFLVSVGLADVVVTTDLPTALKTKTTGMQTL